MGKAKARTQTTANHRGANADDRRVGQRIRQRRLELDMSQETLAVELGLSFQQIQKYEKGVNRVGAGRLREIARMLRVPIGYFFPDEPAGGASSVGDSFMATSEGVMIAQAFVRIANPVVRQTIARFVRDLTEAHHV
jgi:transcriptional regulator with XRE-family HTH domain